MRKIVELRIRHRGEEAFRLELGAATTRAQLGELQRQRDLLRRLHDRGEGDVLLAVKEGRTTAAAVERVVDEWGINDYRKHLSIEPPRPDVIMPTLDDHVVRWLKTIKKDGTRKTYQQNLAHLRAFVLEGERLGDRPWHLAAPRHVIRDVKDSLRASKAGNTIRTVMGSWSAFFEWAIEREQSEAAQQGRPPVIETNPVRSAKAWDPIEITRHRFLTWDEAQELLKVSPVSMRAQYATLFLAGLRIDELLSMPPAHVHLPTHIHVGPFGTWAPKGYPRSKHGVRDIPIHHVLLPLLEDYAQRYAGDERFFVNPTSGNRWTRDSFSDRLEKDVKAAGMIFGQSLRPGGKLTRIAAGITAHTMRHTLASWLAQSDVQLLKIAAILGDTVETVSKHYAHLLPRDLDQAINRIGAPQP